MFPSSYNIQTSTLLSVNHIEHAHMRSLVLKNVAKCKLHVLWVTLSTKEILNVEPQCYGKDIEKAASFMHFS